MDQARDELYSQSTPPLAQIGEASELFEQNQFLLRDILHAQDSAERSKYADQMGLVGAMIVTVLIVRVV